MKTAWKGFTQYTSSHDSLDNLYNNEYDLFTYGAGYLDIDCRSRQYESGNRSSTFPTAVFNSNNTVTIVSTTPDSEFAGSSVVWGAIRWFGELQWFGVRTYFPQPR
jgi:hypothetical protein